MVDLIIIPTFIILKYNLISLQYQNSASLFLIFHQSSVRHTNFPFSSIVDTFCVSKLMHIYRMRIWDRLNNAAINCVYNRYLSYCFNILREFYLKRINGKTFFLSSYKYKFHDKPYNILTFGVYIFNEPQHFPNTMSATAIPHAMSLKVFNLHNKYFSFFLLLGLGTIFHKPNIYSIKMQNDRNKKKVHQNETRKGIMAKIQAKYMLWCLIDDDDRRAHSQ